MLRFLAVSLLGASCCFAQFPNETDRLMATARLWVTVEYFHPYLGYRDIDWDGALVKAIPKIRAATDNNSYRAALTEMLNELNDSETKVVPEGLMALTSENLYARQLSLVRTANSKSFTVTTEETGTKFAHWGDTGCQFLVRVSAPYKYSDLNSPISSKARRYDETYPSTELRLLAAIKTWGAIRYFFAYKDLIDEDWDDVFATYLSKFIEARDAIDYNLTFADLLTHLTDTYTTIHSKTLDTYFGETPVGLRIRLLEKYPIVTEVLDPAAKTAGIRPGDVIKRIAGVSTTDIFRRFVQYIPASTPQRSGYDTVQKVTNGPPGSEVELTIEDAKGKSHTVKLTRTANPDNAQRTTDRVQILPGNIGYLDLDRITETAVRLAMERLKSTKAIILDLRGHAPAAPALVPYLVSETNVPVALVTTPIAIHPDIQTDGIATQTASTFVVRTLPNPAQPHYAGKTIALIDERTIGDSEYAGLLFKAANKTDLVGMPTAGAYSTLTDLALPGGITLTYSTQDIRQANGGKLQRLGLQPNVDAPTTARGLRAGKDETLEAALSYLSH